VAVAQLWWDDLVQSGLTAITILR